MASLAKRGIKCNEDQRRPWLQQLTSKTDCTCSLMILLTNRWSGITKPSSSGCAQSRALLTACSHLFTPMPQRNPQLRHYRRNNSTVLVRKRGRPGTFFLAFKGANCLVPAFALSQTCEVTIRFPPLGGSCWCLCATLS